MTSGKGEVTMEKVKRICAFYRDGTPLYPSINLVDGSIRPRKLISFITTHKTAFYAFAKAEYLYLLKTQRKRKQPFALPALYEKEGLWKGYNLINPISKAEEAKLDAFLEKHQWD